MKKRIKPILAILILLVFTFGGYQAGKSGYALPAQKQSSGTPTSHVENTPNLFGSNQLTEKGRALLQSSGLITDSEYSFPKIETKNEPVYSYVASRNSDVFHRLNCSYVNNINDSNKVYYESREDADARKRPCSRCKP